MRQNQYCAAISLLVVSVLVCVPNAYGGTLECKLRFRHTCQMAKCDTLVMPLQTLRFDPYGSKVELCGGFNRNDDECETHDVTWSDHLPRLAIILSSKDDGTKQAPRIISYEPIINSSTVWLIDPLSGGVGVIAGRCTAKSK